MGTFLGVTAHQGTTRKTERKPRIMVTLEQAKPVRCVCTWCDTPIELNEATGQWFVPGGYYLCPESPNDLHAT